VVTGPARTIDADYRARLEARRASLAAHERAHAGFAYLRLAIAGSAVVLLMVLGLGGLAWLLVPVAAFLAVAVVHGRLLDARDRCQRALRYYERALGRLAHQWIGHGEPGDRLRPTDHLYANDLDIFGRGSLFELVATTRTRAGEDTLAAWLLAPAPPHEVVARQDAVSELIPRLDLREAMAVLGEDLRAGVDAAGLRAWASAPRRLSGGAIRLVPAVAAVMVWTLMVAWALTGGRQVLLLAAVALAAGTAAVFRAHVLPVIHEVEEPTRDLELLTGVIRLIERESFTSPRLVELQRALTGGAHRASSEIWRLEQLAAMLASRDNVMFAIPAALTLWATQLAFAIEAWRRRSGSRVPGWLDAVGEFEALSALATFAAEHPDFVWPEFVDGRPVLEATALAHPLLDDHAVANDIAFGQDAPRLFIVSGSNMSGKSTFLRAVGVNVVLAQAGAPVRARALHLSPLAIGASIRIDDSLSDGRSRFFTEITRLKRVVDLAGARPGATIFLLDEILGGTNSHDRRHGAAALLSELVSREAIGLVTTHDLALGEIPEQPDSRAANVHFEDSFANGQLTFDYRLRPGIVRTSNAIPLMRAVGLKV